MNAPVQNLKIRRKRDAKTGTLPDPESDYHVVSATGTFSEIGFGLVRTPAPGPVRRPGSHRIRPRGDPSTPESQGGR